MIYQVCDRLCLDSTGTDGLATEVSAVIPLEGANTVQFSVVLPVLTATGLVAQLQVSIDGGNWQNHGSSVTFSTIGRKFSSALSGIAASSARIQFTLDGTGKAIVDAHAAVSEQ